MTENPFLINGYVSPDLFCDRENELSELTTALTNGRNITLVSPRRMGKTGLILRLFEQLEKQNIKTIYLDIFAARSLDEMIKSLLEAVLSKFPEKSSLGHKFMSFIRALRPLFSFDDITGMPQIQIVYQSEQEKEQTLHHIFDFLESQQIPIVIAIDEFQQITTFPETRIEAILRTEIQLLHNLTFIFCGSKRSLMIDIFSNAKRPFYASTQFIYLQKIDKTKYADFIQSLFIGNGFTIDTEAVDFILQWTKTYTYYTQYLCNAIYARRQAHVNIELVNTICHSILNQSDTTYLQLRQLLTTAQWNYLIAVAKVGEVSKITAQQFLMTYKIGSPANSKRLVQALCEKELLLETIGEKQTTYQIYDVFFMHWLNAKY